MLKTIFKAVKSGTEGRGIDRVFVTGVSPVVMSDITSGFNIATDIYLEPEFNDLCGFHAEEIAYVASLPQGEKVVSDALNEKGELRLEEFADRFGVEEVLHGAKYMKFMVSLLYYFGVLTLAGKRTEFEEHVFRIPNLAIRKLYVERLKETMLPTGPDLDDARAAAKKLCQLGAIEPLCAFIERGPLIVFDNRDYRWTNEFAVKTVFLALLYNDTLYVMDSEPGLGRRYADLVMLVRPDFRHSALLDILIEFKYVPLKEIGLSGEQVRKTAKEQLESLPSVKRVFSEAKRRLADYRRSLLETRGDSLRLHAFAVVALDFERLLWEKLADQVQ